MASQNGRKAEDTVVYVKKVPEYERRIAELRELCLRDDIKLVMMNGRDKLSGEGMRRGWYRKTRERIQVRLDVAEAQAECLRNRELAKLAVKTEALRARIEERERRKKSLKTVKNLSEVLSPYLKLADKENSRITIEVVNTSTPDVVDICCPEMELNTITWDANTVDASIVSSVSTAEPMPWLRFNLANFPNMQE